MKPPKISCTINQQNSAFFYKKTSYADLLTFNTKQHIPTCISLCSRSIPQVWTKLLIPKRKLLIITSSPPSRQLNWLKNTLPRKTILLNRNTFRKCAPGFYLCTCAPSDRQEHHAALLLWSMLARIRHFSLVFLLRWIRYRNRFRFSLIRYNVSIKWSWTARS